MVLTEINKEWPSDKNIPSFRPHNREEVLKLDEFVRRLTEGEGSSKFVFQKCGLGPNAIREMVMSHMRERRRKEKDSCVTDCKLPSAGDSGGDTESVESSSNDSSSSNQSAVEKKRQEYTDYFHPCKYKQMQITTFFITAAISIDLLSCVTEVNIVGCRLRVATKVSRVTSLKHVI